MNVAALVDGPGAVRVAIEQEAEVVAAVANALQRLVHVGADGLGVEAAEPGVALAVDLVDADPAAREQPTDPARPGAIQRIDEHAHLLSLEPVQVERAPHVRLVADERVEALDGTRCLGIGERTPGRSRRSRDRR